MSRRHIPDDQKRLVLTMLQRGKSVKEVRESTGWGLTTIKRVRKYHSLYGTVSRPAAVKGRHRILQSELVLDVSLPFLLVEIY